MPQTRVLMITQETEPGRRIVLEARSLLDAGYDVKILTRAAGSDDEREAVDGVPVERLALRGRDTRFRWLYPLVGTPAGSRAAALWGVVSGRTTFARRALPEAIAARADIYHAHDLNNLEVASIAARAWNARLVFDAHELFTEIANPWIALRRGRWRRLEHELLPRADLVITVNDLIAEELTRRHGISSPLVLLNCGRPQPAFDPAAPHEALRARLGLGRDRQIVLFEGLFARGRGLEYLVRAAQYLAPETVVVLMGQGERKAVLERLAARVAPERVRFLPPVPQQEVFGYCASADVGVLPLQPVDRNHVLASPSKLFDYIQSGLPIVANDLPFLRRTIERHGLGLVARIDSPQTCAGALNQLLRRPAELERIRANARIAARHFTWAAESSKLIDAYAALEGR